MHNRDQYRRELLDLLKRIDFVLSKKRIRYYLVYGSCLGAIREGGIIPWDDDIDIAVWRNDFNLVLKELSCSRYQIFAGDKKNVPGCPTRCGRIFNRIDENSSIERQRAFIDLHVIDYASRNLFVFYFKVFWYVGISRIIDKRNGYCFGKHFIIYTLTDFLTFPFRILSTNILERVANWLYISNNVSPYVKVTFDGNRKRYFTKSFLKSTRHSFSGMNLPVPEGYADFLTNCYGDWKTPPPKKDRKSHVINELESNWTVEYPAVRDRYVIKESLD